MSNAVKHVKNHVNQTFKTSNSKEWSLFWKVFFIDYSLMFDVLKKNHCRRCGETYVCYVLGIHPNPKQKQYWHRSWSVLPLASLDVWLLCEGGMAF